MNFDDARNTQQVEDLAPPPGFVDEVERRAHRRGQARHLQSDMGERTAAE